MSFRVAIADHVSICCKKKRQPERVKTAFLRGPAIFYTTF